MGRFIAIAAVLTSSLLGCSPRSPTHVSATGGTTVTFPTPAAAPASTGLVAVLSPGPEPGTIAVEYRNHTAAEAVVSAQVITSNILALEVTDAAGRRQDTIPPSIPWIRDGGVRIPPGGVRRFEYGLNMFGNPLPPGRYRVRVAIEGWTCEPLDFTVGR